MKKFTYLYLFLLPILFFSCEKLDEGSTVTFYVSNAGDEGTWAHIKVEIGSLYGAFFTPNNQNMVLNSCEGQSNSLSFDLPPGTYSYVADFGTWTGTFTLGEDECKIIALHY